MGEISRSLYERTKEHWNDAVKDAPDSHMRKHWEEAHKEEKERLVFNQYVVAKYKSCLERQIGEAVRIQLRGNVLNSAGVYNRSKLTRLVVDSEWDKKVFASNWLEIEESTKNTNIESGDNEDIEVTSARGIKRSAEQTCQKKKKRRFMNQPELVWGIKKKDPVDAKKSEFLYNTRLEETSASKYRQPKLNLPAYYEVAVKDMVKMMVDEAVEVGIKHAEETIEKEDEEKALNIIIADEEWENKALEEVNNSLMEVLINILEELDIISKEEEKEASLDLERNHPHQHYQPSRSVLFEPPGRAQPVRPGGSLEDLLGIHPHNHTKTENQIKTKFQNTNKNRRS